MGQRWSKIAKLNGRRNEHMIKNRYYSLKNKWIKNNCEINFKINRLIRDI